MTLDLAAISRQIAGMAAGAPWRSQRDGLALALRLLSRTDPAALRDRIESARTSWLVAVPYGDLAGRIPAPPGPPAWEVLATDGSLIPPERHSPVHFFVLNIGRVRLRYGPAPDAAIDAAARLYYQPDETHLTLPDGVRRLPIDGARLAAKRAVAELEALADLADEADDLPPVALQDGTLILWGLQNEEMAVQARFIDAYLAAADRLRRRETPLAAYISAPASTDVVNALRVAFCPHVPVELATVNCDRCPSRLRAEGPACNKLSSLTDRWLFEQVLAPGERSDLFFSRSTVLRQYVQRDPDHDVLFFYLHAGLEVARVEVPAWVAAQPDLLDRVHAAVYDQCRRGQGYPTALQEAHEAAVIHAEERRLVETLIDETMARAGLTMRRSAKDASKRVRAL